MHEIGKLNRLNLGYVGENDSRVISIDVSEWLKRWPGATVYVQAVRPDGEKYIAATEIVDGVLTWEVAAEEVLVNGKGFAQFTALDLESGKEYKTRVIGTFIAESLEYFNKELEDDDPMQKWVNRIVAADESAKRSAGEAAESATKASDSEKAAGESAVAASESAKQAADSERAAGESANAAEESAARASDSEKVAGESAVAAAASATQAANSEKNAAKSAVTAQSSAAAANTAAETATEAANKIPAFRIDSKGDIVITL